MTAEEARGAERLKELFGDDDFDLAVILGSGLGALAQHVQHPVPVDYREIPGFPSEMIAGHSGRLIAGCLEGWKVLVFQGRLHLYQGHDAHQASLPVRLAHGLGCRRILLTNAVGGVNPSFRVGDFMVISDHINLMGDNPLRGERVHPFVDLCGLYLQSFFSRLSEYAEKQSVGLHRGVLAALMGPSYETPAEIRCLQSMGADVVSMSMVPEAIMARYLGMEIAGLSLVSNPAAGMAPSGLSHEEVLAAGKNSAEKFTLLARELIRIWRDQSC